MNWQRQMAPSGVGVAGRNGPRRGGRGRIVPAAAAALVLVVVAVSGCAGDSDAGSRARPAASARQTPPASTKASPTPTAEGSVCTRALAVQNSIGVLTSLDYTEVGGVQAAIAQVQKNLQALRASASAEWEKQVTALSKEVAQLGAAVENLQGQETTSKAWQAMGNAAEGVGDSATELRESLSSMCPDLQKGIDGDR